LGWFDRGASRAGCCAAAFPTREVLSVSVDTDAGPLPAELATDASIAMLQIARGRGFGTNAVADALNECASDRDVAVLVIGSRGRSAAREFLLGSVAQATLHNAERPVMVVPRV
jgi:hypothetical protein